MSDHNLSPENTAVVSLLTTLVVQVYLPMFYEIKVKHHIRYGPIHLLKLFRLWRQQDESVRDASRKYLKDEAWWAHPEALLVSLLCSSEPTEREFAVNKIMELRQGEEMGSTSVREFKVPSSVNLEATNLLDIINWGDENITEPVFTSKLTTSQLISLKSTPLSLPDFVLHTQSCERSVKLVTKAAESVCGWARRDGFVRAQMKSREQIPVLKTKRDFSAVFE